MRIAFLGGAGPVGEASVPRLLAAGHDVLVAHTGRHEPSAVAAAEHVHGERADVLPLVRRWRPSVVVDTFAGGATAAKGLQLSRLAERIGVRQVVAISSMDVYEHCADAGVDDARVLELSRHAVPLSEHAALRSPHPTGTPHDNLAMERALGGAAIVTTLRPGAVYGPSATLHDRFLREWHLVGMVHRGERRLALPDGGTQLFHRVALERVGRAIHAAIERGAGGPINVGDPNDLSYGALAGLVGERLGWTWEIEHVRWPDGDHPWNVRHPVLCDTTRLRTELGVTEPDPRSATLATVDWLWQHREELAARRAARRGAPRP